jgi:hypothetical protein
MIESVSTRSSGEVARNLCMQEAVHDIVFRLISFRRSSVNLVTGERSGWKMVAKSVKSSTKRSWVAGCTQIKISTKCLRKGSKGRRRSRKLSLGEKGAESLQGGEPLRLSPKSVDKIHPGGK